jgi:hypothetical protein
MQKFFCGGHRRGANLPDPERVDWRVALPKEHARGHSHAYSFLYHDVVVRSWHDLRFGALGGAARKQERAALVRPAGVTTFS